MLPNAISIVAPAIGLAIGVARPFRNIDDRFIYEQTVGTMVAVERRRDRRLTIYGVDETSEGPLADSLHLPGDDDGGTMKPTKRFVRHFIHTAGEEGGDAATHQRIGGCLDNGIAVVAAVINWVIFAHYHFAEMQIAVESAGRDKGGTGRDEDLLQVAVGEGVFVYYLQMIR